MSIRIAIQKSGRLYEDSREILEQAGIRFSSPGRRLLVKAHDFPAEIMLVRDDDIPRYVADGICQLGIVGQNIIIECDLENTLQERLGLGFGHCRLSLAQPSDAAPLPTYQNKTIATSYPTSLQKYLDAHGVDARVVEITGAVEITPTLGVADAICDLVSTGATLKSNGLKETEVMFESEAVLVSPQNLSPEAADLVELVEKRLRGALRARRSRYIMMNAPKDAVERIAKLLPGVRAPTVLPLQADESRVAIHAVAEEDVFWDTMEALKQSGADGILVMPIEKMIE